MPLLHSLPARGAFAAAAALSASGCFDPGNRQPCVPPQSPVSVVDGAFTYTLPGQSVTTFVGDVTP